MAGNNPIEEFMTTSPVYNFPHPNCFQNLNNGVLPPQYLYSEKFVQIAPRISTPFSGMGPGSSLQPSFQNNISAFSQENRTDHSFDKDDEEDNFIAENMGTLKALKKRKHSKQQQNSTEEKEVLSTEEKEQLIEEVRKYRCIWDLKSPFYKDLGKRKIAWESINNSFDKKYTGK